MDNAVTIGISHWFMYDSISGVICIHAKRLQSYPPTEYNTVAWCASLWPETLIYSNVQYSQQRNNIERKEPQQDWSRINSERAKRANAAKVSSLSWKPPTFLVKKILLYSSIRAISWPDSSNTQIHAVTLKLLILKSPSSYFKKKSQSSIFCILKFSLPSKFTQQKQSYMCKIFRFPCLIAKTLIFL